MSLRSRTLRLVSDKQSQDNQLQPSPAEEIQGSFEQLSFSDQPAVLAAPVEEANPISAPGMVDVSALASPDYSASANVPTDVSAMSMMATAVVPAVLPDQPVFAAVAAPELEVGYPGESFGASEHANVAAENVPDPALARRPMVIQGSGKKSSSIRPPKKAKNLTRGRLVLHATVTAVIFITVFAVLAAVVPVNTRGETVGEAVLHPSGINMTSSKQNMASLIVAQEATATAVMQDGVEYGASTQFAGVNYAALPTLPQTGSFVNLNTPGQCTYWADYRYHQLTGYAVPWVGNAMLWSSLAYNYSGWVVSSTPVVPSIIVLQPGVQHASYVGHVGVVESINADGSVYTSDWNIIGPGIYSNVTYYPGAGVAFVYHVG